MKRLNLSLDVLNGATQDNRIDPVLVWRLCEHTHGRFVSDALRGWQKLEWFQGETGFDVRIVAGFHQCVLRVRASGGLRVQAVGEGRQRSGE